MGDEAGSRPPAVVPGQGDARPAAHGWAGWVLFAGLLLILLGLGHVLQGLSALVTGQGAELLVSSDASGWTLIVLGVAGGLIGLGLLAGVAVARGLAVVIALISAVVNLASIPDSPGAVVIVAFDVVVVYAVTVHGGELHAASYR